MGGSKDTTQNYHDQGSVARKDTLFEVLDQATMHIRPTLTNALVFGTPIPL
jgi:hypothetical protein